MAPNIRSVALLTATFFMNSDTIVIWGAGAMGGSLGAWLLRAGQPVLFVDTDEQHAQVIRKSGLTIIGPVDEFSVDAD